MKKIVKIVSLCSLLSVPCVVYSVMHDLEVPMLAFKALGESRVEKCGYCVKNSEKRAFRIIDDYFAPGKVFIFNGKNSEQVLLKNRFCRKGEFLSFQYKDREKGVNGKGEKFEFPLLVFYFHTDRHHHAGVNRRLFTDKSIDSIYMKPAGKKDGCFKARIKIINYPYGNGRSFIYFRKRNIIQVHCIVENITSCRLR